MSGEKQTKSANWTEGGGVDATQQIQKEKVFGLRNTCGQKYWTRLTYLDPGCQLKLQLVEMAAVKGAWK